MNEERNFKETWTERERKAKVSLLADEIKAKKKMPLDDFYRFALTTLMVSKRVIDNYLNELKLSGLVKIEVDYTPLITEYVVWAGE